ncbi:MAG TPA: nucleotide exchange factor GrpE [Candidatus Blautia stercoripullorum]|uniref:Protein GrpE n=1 Tax=Candidatus Blautia stercoripullorum TaxID=2838502 RepID=A0A9D2U4Q9_9FIRM|nr:nucleotide exchange factor GrpE [Candidatus Blautia stercoripullorum]
MAEEKREFNPIDEETVSEDQAEEIIKEDDENAAEEAGEEEIKEETDEEASGNTEEDEQKEPEKKGFFKKKKDKKDEKIEELTDMVKRQMAEFDNYRKRTEKEKSSMYEIGAREVIEKILPIVDNFERGLAAVPEEEKDSPFVEGMNKVYRQLLSSFEGMGVKTIESVGQEFNPDYHNAVMHVEDEEAGENTVVEEFQKGYTYKDTVIRHSMVKVAN